MMHDDNGAPRIFTGLGRSILLRFSALALLFTILAVAFVASTTLMSHLSDLIFFDAQSLQNARGLENVLMLAEREHQLLRTNGREEHRSQRDTFLADAARIVNDLEASSADEKSVADDIKVRFADYIARIEHDTETDAPRRRDALLESIMLYRSINQRQMNDRDRESDTLNNDVQIVSVFILIIVFSLLAAISINLWRRIAWPILELTATAAKFGAGDLSVRVTPRSGDELANLGATFNAMADDISLREKDKLEFMASIVHDIRNPLVVIGGAADLILTKSAADDPHRSWLETIIANARRIETRTADLMDTVEAGSDRIRLARQMVELEPFVRGIVEEQRKIHPRCEIGFRADEGCAALVDRRRMERILENLISNALKYSPEERGIAVEVRRDAEEVVVAVEDQGPGISAEEMKSLFQPFGRLDRTAGKIQGTGLGLYSVKKIVEAHGGSVGIRSEPGKGTRVEARFAAPVR